MSLRRFNIRIFYRTFFFTALLIFHTAVAQNLSVITTPKEYRQTVANDSLRRMVEIKSLIPDISYDLRYATTKNFTGEKLYKSGSQTFVRLSVAKVLKKVNEALAVKGYRLKIWDAYRPYSVTKKMWELVHDERYAANPAKGSGHNRGLAVDLTIVDAATGNELDMGTGFDNFSDSAHHDFKELPTAVLQNRNLLKTLMIKSGFQPLETEWWHYSLPNDKNYELLDLPFKKLRNHR